MKNFLTLRRNYQFKKTALKKLPKKFISDQKISVNEALRWFQNRAVERGLDRDAVEYSYVSKLFAGGNYILYRNRS